VAGDRLPSKRCPAGEGNSGGRGNPVAVASSTQVGKVHGAQAVLEESSAGSGNSWRWPSWWGKADGAVETRAAAPAHKLTAGAAAAAKYACKVQQRANGQ
jgi:hypothetical protein